MDMAYEEKEGVCRPNWVAYPRKKHKKKKMTEGEEHSDDQQEDDSEDDDDSDGLSEGED
jgi:hypothetical protein